MTDVVPVLQRCCKECPNNPTPAHLLPPCLVQDKEVAHLQWCGSH